MSVSGLSRKHVAAAVIGNALEFYDFVTYAFFAVQIGHAFFPTHNAYASLMLSLATFGAGFAMRPLGGILLGRYADRVGRRPAMLLSYALMGGAIFVVAITPSYSVIGVAAPILVVIARMAQGLALGGEVGSSTAFLMEAAPPRQRGFYTAWQAGSQSLASLAGGFVGATLSVLLAPDTFATYGWRIAFALGALTIPFGIIIRNNLPETLHLAEATSANAQAGDTGALLRANIRPIVAGFLILAAGTIFTYVTSYMATFAETILHMSSTVSLCATIVIGLFGTIGSLFSGWLSDRIGRWPVMVWSRLLYLVSAYPIYAWMIYSRSAVALLAGTAALQFFGIMSIGAFYSAMSESLPKRIRGITFGTIYATAIAIFGGTTQLVITWLLRLTGSPFAPAFYVIGASVIGLAAACMMAETAPAKLRGGSLLPDAVLAPAD